MQTLAAIVVIATVYGTLPCNGRPGSDEPKKHAASSHVSSSSGGYQASLSETDVNGKCAAKLVIQGNGVHKVIDYHCTSIPKPIINLDNSLLVGNDYFADSPNILIHLLGSDKCEKEVFEKVGGQYTSKKEPMDEKACKEIDDKVEKLKERQEQWKKWYEEEQKKAQEELQQLQDSLKNLDKLFKGFGIPMGI